MRSFLAYTAAVIVAFSLGLPAFAADWPQFRGPTGQGHTAERNLPLTWDAKTGQNVLWHSPLKGEGHASPVISGNHIFICTVLWAEGTADRKKVIPDHFVTCFDLRDGKQLWQTQVQPGPWRRDDFRSGPGGGYAAPTPCTNGKLVFVVFSSSVIAALDFEGKIAWRKEIVPYTFDVTIGTSPILHGDHVLFFCTMAKKGDSRLIAFDQKTGDIAWEAKLPTTGFGHSTPLLIEVKGKPQLLLAAGAMGGGSEGLQSFDPATGKRLWWCKGGGESSSPAYGDGIVYFDSGRGGAGTAVDPTGEGDVSASHIRWTTGNLPEAIASPIIVGGLVYRLKGGSVLDIYDAKSGERAYQGRLAVTTSWASPIADGKGRIYFASAGKSVVIEAGREGKVLATNDLGDGNHASPAVAGGKMVLMGIKQVWCVGEKKP